MAESAKDGSTATADADERKRILNRLKRLEGQIRGLQTMVDADQGCDAVLTQVMAAKSALNQVGLLIIAHSMKDCVRKSGTESVDEAVDQALTVLMRYVNLGET